MSIEKICKICDKVFYVDPHRKDEAQYCSRDCANEGQRLVIGPDHPLWIERVKFTCEKCGKEFEVLPSEIPRRFCSRECSGNARNQVTIYCAQCNTEFTVTPAILKRGRRFCSRHCMFTYKGQTSIEKRLADELKRCGIEFEYQYHISNGNPKGWWIDFAFPLHSLAVEADGNYWHSMDSIQEKDARKDADLAEQGWTVLRFTGDEIRQSVSTCVDEIIEHLS